ncbi:hypothetical protein [Streptomyces sp. KMM 9044]|uniref:hypothetical protein n=1 Tax=Streptomyces sp. KMM 9044 TaxID=2744474 RepID=UPI002150F0E5|nr:hypothetical protein [Streptomyces sp. KMM 9044]WAX81494.1 hypothetical protein HUV60_031580 [Streptomyces sp. KMM 9044]
MRDNPGALAPSRVDLQRRDAAALRGPWHRTAAKELSAIGGGLPPGPGYRSHSLFSGAVEGNQLSRTGRPLLHLLGGRFGDFRDWRAGDGWATAVAGDLRTGG